MKITLEEVKRIAHLAHLQFSEQELEKLRGQLDQILVYVDKLGELPTDGVEPAVGVIGVSDAPTLLRSDETGPTLALDEALANAPASGHGHFKVPKVIG